MVRVCFFLHKNEKQNKTKNKRINTKVEEDLIIMLTDNYTLSNNNNIKTIMYKTEAQFGAHLSKE